MSGPVFVRDAQETPLMPMSAAYARKLLSLGRAQRVPHPTFMLVQLTQTVAHPVLRPVMLGVRIHLHTAELLLVAAGERTTITLLRVLVDLRTDLPRRLRRRAAHRKRRRTRGRYRAPRRHGVPYKLRRPSRARSAQSKPHRRYQTRHTNRKTVSPTLRWRAQTIMRVITALRALVPISHIAMLIPNSDRG